MKSGSITAAEKPAIESASKAGTRILLIEDDSAYVFLCRRYLQQDEHFDHVVKAVATVKDALDCCAKEDFDCILIDYRLPDRMGTDVIRELRRCQAQPLTATIVLSADGGEEAATAAVRAGANDFLAKRNVTQQSLCRAIKNAVEKNRLQTSLSNRVRELEAANDQLRRRSEEIRRFYHTVSHEVKTPLTAIQEFVAIVHDGVAGDVSDEQKTILQYALESCGQISSHFNELLELSLFETGKMKAELAPGDLYKVLNHCVVATTPAAAAKGIDLHIENSADFPPVLMQSNRIIQVLSNLIRNAIKFTEAGGRVTVACQLMKESNRLRLSVRDTGCGIPPSHIKKVFERLYQVRPATDRGNDPGMGLGLSIASEIVSLHGSRIELASEVGAGSEFSFSLAFAEARDAAWVA